MSCVVYIRYMFVCEIAIRLLFDLNRYSNSNSNSNYLPYDQRAVTSNGNKQWCNFALSSVIHALFRPLPCGIHKNNNNNNKRGVSNMIWSCSNEILSCIIVFAPIHVFSVCIAVTHCRRPGACMYNCMYNYMRTFALALCPCFLLVLVLSRVHLFAWIVPWAHRNRYIVQSAHRVSYRVQHRVSGCFVGVW